MLLVAAGCVEGLTHVNKYSGACTHCMNVWGDES